MGKKLFAICISIIAFNLLVLIYFLSITIYVYCFNDLEPKDYRRISLNVPNMEYTLTKEEVRQIIKDLYNTPHIYVETNELADNRYADCNVYTRIIRIKPDLKIIDYATSYAHELTHLKYMYGDETITSFKAFVMLYESGNEQLRNMALKDAQSIIYGVFKGTQYDCGYYIIQYLKDVGYL